MLRWLADRGTPANIASLARYGIRATRPFGVTVGDLKRQAKQLGPSHALALALWKSGRYEARLLAAFVDEPERVTLAQMKAWIADCDNWALVDTLCFALFDRAPQAWKPLAAWARSKEEFVRRAAFAQLWALALHDRTAPDQAFVEGLALVEACAGDERHFVKKGVDMALRAVGTRNRALQARALSTCGRLLERDEPSARWIGGHAQRELRRKRPRA